MPYTVAPGDSLSKIAEANGLTLAELRELNPGLFDAAHNGGNLIQPGETVVLSTDTPAEAAEAVGTPPAEAPAEGGDVDAGGGVTVTGGAPEEETAARGGVGAGGEDAETQLTILTGRKMSWYFDRNSGKWYVGYGLESGREMIFEATPDQMDALFGVGFRPSSYTNTTLSGLTSQTGVTFSGNIAEMEGEGTFEAEVARVTALALDEGILPEWAQQDGAALDIIFIAQAEGKNNDWVLNQLAALPSFKERFPGLDRLMSQGNLTTDEAITGFLEYEAGIRQALIATGKDPATVTPALVGNLLSAGHSLTAIQQTTQSFDRMQKFNPAMKAFNDILVANGLEPVSTLSDMFDFVSGQAPSELYDIWEASSIAEAASQAGLGDLFTAEDAIEIGLNGDFNLETATAATRKAAELLLRLRNEVNVGEFGLNHEDLIDLSFGRPPRSGQTEAEVNDNINRAVLSAQHNLRTARATPFKGFAPGGVIQSQSLGNLRETS